MTRHRILFVVLTLLLGLSLAACGQEPVEAAHDSPATVDEIEGSELKRITLTAKAAERLDIQTAEVERATDGLTIPYGAVVWDADGTTWTYTSPEELVFVRAPITLDRIDGDQAILDDGPEPGTVVVHVGAAELWGTEHGVGGSGH
jgi:ABC-type oligopeptide transport system substrate-binding subunit